MRAILEFCWPPAERAYSPVLSQVGVPEMTGRQKTSMNQNS